MSLELALLILGAAFVLFLAALLAFTLTVIYIRGGVRYPREINPYALAMVADHENWTAEDVLRVLVSEQEWRDQ